VIVKATEGLTYTNPKMKAQAAAAERNGQLLGFYHYARPENNGAVSEAEFFLKIVGPYLGRCILALDWEQTALKYPAAWAKEFLEHIYERTGVRPLLYIQQSAAGTGKYDRIARAGFGLWMAQYNRAMSSRHGAWEKVTIWQYTSSGGKLDKDYFYGDRQDWLALAGQKKKGVSIVGSTVKGMRGVQVLGLQTMLKEYGYYKAKIDSDFGPKTEQALIAFQRAEGLKADGIAGPKTWARIAALS